MKLKQIALGILSTASRLGHGSRLRGSLKKQQIKALNLGCQTNLVPGWLNVDIVTFPGASYMNAIRPWPIPAGSLDTILCEHMIEHVPKDGGRALIGHAFKALAPGGRIRIVTPSLESFARMSLDPLGDASTKYRAFLASRGETMTPCDAVNSIFYGYGHRYIYDQTELHDALRDAGFDEIAPSPAGHPIDPVFKDVEGHPELLGDEINMIEAFAMEARKPAH